MFLKNYQIKVVGELKRFFQTAFQMPSLIKLLSRLVATAHGQNSAPLKVWGDDLGIKYRMGRKNEDGYISRNIKR